MVPELRDGQDKDDGGVVRKCKPLAEGATCGKSGEGNKCRSGMCTTPKGEPVRAKGLPGKPVPSEPLICGKTPLAPLEHDGGDDDDDSDVYGGGGGSGKAGGRFTVDVDTAAPLGAVIPQGFLGTSNEWTRIEDYDDSEAWATLFKRLGPGNIMRVGGASQDGFEDEVCVVVVFCVVFFCVWIACVWIVCVWIVCVCVCVAARHPLLTH